MYCSISIFSFFRSSLFSLFIGIISITQISCNKTDKTSDKPLKTSSLKQTKSKQENKNGTTELISQTLGTWYRICEAPEYTPSSPHPFNTYYHCGGENFNPPEFVAFHGDSSFISTRTIKDLNQNVGIHSKWSVNNESLLYIKEKGEFSGGLIKVSNDTMVIDYGYEISLFVKLKEEDLKILSKETEGNVKQYLDKKYICITEHDEWCTPDTLLQNYIDLYAQFNTSDDVSDLLEADTLLRNLLNESYLTIYKNTISPQHVKSLEKIGIIFDRMSDRYEYNGYFLHKAIENGSEASTAEVRLFDKSKADSDPWGLPNLLLLDSFLNQYPGSYYTRIVHSTRVKLLSDIFVAINKKNKGTLRDFKEDCYAKYLHKYTVTDIPNLRKEAVLILDSSIELSPEHSNYYSSLKKELLKSKNTLGNYCSDC